MNCNGYLVQLIGIEGVAGIAVSKCVGVGEGAHQAGPHVRVLHICLDFKFSLFYIAIGASEAPLFDTILLYCT